MDNINLKEKSLELKKILADYDKESLIGFFAYFIRQKTTSSAKEDIELFSSKLKDFEYLIGIRYLDKTSSKKHFPDNNMILGEIAEKVNEIKLAYSLNDFSQESFINDLSYQEKAIIHEFTFNNYFHNGALSYVEQDLDLFEQTFKPIEYVLKDNFGLDINFLTDVYKFSERLYKTKFKEKMAFTWDEAYEEIHEKAKLDAESFQKYINSLPSTTKKQFDKFTETPLYDSLLFSKDDYYKEFPKQKVDTFLDTFSCSETDFKNYLFYSDTSPFELKPILKLEDNKFLHIYQKQLPVSYYKFFYKYCDNVLSQEKMQKHRGKVLEDRCYEIFKDFLRNEKKTHIYQNYYLENHIEQDILVVSNGTAFIIEAKAAKFREPFRDMDKAFNRIKDDFKGNIQKGFEQGERVKSLFESGNIFRIYNEKDEVLAEINPLKIYNVFTIIVTQDRLGPIQQNLGLMLKIDDDKEYPFSIYVNDLEIFLRTLKIKTKNPRNEFVAFLKTRELLHERIICIDELDICGFYMSNKNLFVNLANQLEATFTIQPECQDYFDDLYFQGIGILKNEINIEEKRNSGYKPNLEKLKAFRFPDYKEFN